jgi:hypothetical protein
MKLFLMVMSCCFAALMMAAPEKGGKRQMEGAAAVKTYQKEMRQQKAPEESEELTREFFAKNYKAVFASFFGKNEAGEVVRTKKINEETGKLEQLVEKDAKLTPASAKEAWELLEGGETLLVRTNLMETCGFCDGTRYVYYFAEEVKALEAFNDKYHRQHAVKEEKEDDNKKNRNRDYDSNRNSDKEDKSARKRERKEQEFKDLCERAEEYGWSEVSGEVKTAMKVDDEELANLACCWTAIHEEKSPRFRHMCPICKGKVKMKTARTRLFEVSK